MDELVAKRILFDFEIITLITLLIGVTVYIVSGSLRRETCKGVGSQFNAADLVLVWFPLIFFLINPIVSYYAGETAVPVEKSPYQQFVAGAIQLLFFAFVGVITVIIMQHVSVRDAVDMLGLRRRSFPVVAIYGIAGMVISLFVCSWFLGNVFAEYLREALGDLDAQRAVQEMKAAKSMPVIILSVVLACVAAPIVEELLFRGYLYGVLKKFTSPLFGALISSALFAVVHSNLPALVPLWVFAIILTLSYEMSRSLWVPILIHALFNGFNIVLMFSSNSA